MPNFKRLLWAIFGVGMFDIALMAAWVWVFVPQTHTPLVQWLGCVAFALLMIVGIRIGIAFRDVSRLSKNLPSVSSDFPWTAPRIDAKDLSSGLAKDIFSGLSKDVFADLDALGSHERRIPGYHEEDPWRGE